MPIESSLERFPWDNICLSNVALCDATTIVDLCHDPTWSILSTSLQHWLTPSGLDSFVQTLYATRTRQSGRAGPIGFTSDADLQLAGALTLLERICVHDAVLVDPRALESLRGPANPLERLSSLRDFLRLVEIPEQEYKYVGQSISGYMKRAQDLGWESFINHRGVGSNERRELDDFYDKGYQDFLQKSWVHVPSVMAQSDQSAPRALFYFELARRAGCPVFLSPKKDHWFKTLAQHLARDAYVAVERIFESKMVQEVREALATEFHVSTDLPSPPLIRLITKNARTKGISLLESALEIRARDDAVQFRSYIHRIALLFLAGESTLRDLHSELQKLSEIAEKWAEHGVGEGATFARRTLSLEAIPAIGWIFKLTGTGNMSVNDPLLSKPDRYLSFISSWYAA